MGGPDSMWTTMGSSNGLPAMHGLNLQPSGLASPATPDTSDLASTAWNDKAVSLARSSLLGDPSVQRWRLLGRVPREMRPTIESVDPVMETGDEELLDQEQEHIKLALDNSIETHMK